MPNESGVLDYDQRLIHDWPFAMAEADRAFGSGRRVFRTLSMLSLAFTERGISHAIAGSVATYAHCRWGLMPKIEILMTREGFDQLASSGDLAEVIGGRAIDSDIPIELLISGDFPGDRRPQPVAYPDPAGASVEIDGLRYLCPSKLVELMLASGMTGVRYMIDLAEVVEMIRRLNLPDSFRGQLHPYVRPKYDELWAGLQEPLHGSDIDVETFP